jgi:monoamine oxidase
MSSEPRVSDQVDVVVIGAGLSGLVAARRLQPRRARVCVVEARDRPGGRTWFAVCGDGQRIERGGELVAPHMTPLVELAAEYRLGLEPFTGEGSSVRMFGGERLVEDFPLASDSAAMEAYAAATADLDRLAKMVPVEAPWSAERAAEWDSMTLQTWISAYVKNNAARAAMAAELDYTGAAYGELSFLFALWLIHSMGGWEQWGISATHRISGGTSVLVEALVKDIGDQLILGEPVRQIAHSDAGVTVYTDSHAISAATAVIALAPRLAAAIQFDPPLPPARQRLQERYLMGHGIKFVARYEERWWLDAGLSGLGLGGGPVSILMDATAAEASGGTLLGFVVVTSKVAAEHGDALADEQSGCATFVSQIADYLGPGPEPIEVHMFDWARDPWSAGCAVSVPPGVLSTVGSTLRVPIGRLIWAGAETGLPQIDWLNGAVSAGERAAVEALEIVGLR